MPSKRVIVITFILLAVFVPLSLYFDTSLFFQKLSVNPIKVLYKTEDGIMGQSSSNPVANITFYGYPYPNFTITNWAFTIDNMFNDSEVRLMFSYQNITNAYPFYHQYSNNSLLGGYFDNNEIAQYVKTNPPDMVVTSPLIKNGTYYFWRDVPEMLDGINVKIVHFQKFLTQTSFGTWEGELLLDASKDMIELNNQTFAPVEVDQTLVSLKIQNHYQIQNIESMSASQSANGLVVTKTLVSGETFHLVIKDSNLDVIGAIVGYISGLGIPSTVIGIIVSALYDNRKRKRVSKKESENVKSTPVS